MTCLKSLYDPACQRTIPLEYYLEILRAPRFAWGGREMVDGEIRENPDPVLPVELAAARDDLQKLLQTYAPRVYWHNADPFGPADPLRFVQGSSLWFAHDWIPDHRVVAVGEVDPKKLTGDDIDTYTHLAASWFLHRGLSVYPSDERVITQPYYKYGVEDGDEGFYLRLEDPTLGTGEEIDWCDEILEERRYTDPFPPRQAPTFARLSDPVVAKQFGEPAYGHALEFIEYWRFMNYSHSRKHCFGCHQGDWEGMGVLVDLWLETGRLQHRAMAYYLFQHRDGIAWFCPDEITMTNEETPHPVIYSALGTHATYDSIGLQERPHVLPDDITEPGREWNSYEWVIPIGTEPWYGFTGAWGVRNFFPDNSSYMAPVPGFQKVRGYPDLYDQALVDEVRERCGKD